MVRLSEKELLVINLMVNGNYTYDQVKRILKIYK